MIDSGSATAETTVARQSRKNSQTTKIARIAPSMSISIDALKRLLNVADLRARLGELDLRILALQPLDDRARVLRDVERARAPRAHDLEADDGLAVESAAERCSPAWSRTSAIVSSRTLRPSGNAIGSPRRS